MNTLAFRNIPIYIFYLAMLYICAFEIGSGYIHLKTLIALSIVALLSMIVIYKINRESDIYEDSSAWQTKGIIYSRFEIYILTCTLLIILFWYVSLLYALFFVLLLAVSVIYSIGPRLKRFLILKNIIPSSVWYFSTALIIYYSCNMIIPFIDILKYLFFIFTYTFIIEILWDIPDSQADKENNIQTIPNTFGLTFTKAVLLFLLTLEYIIQPTLRNAFVLSIIAILIILLNNRIHKKYYIVGLCIMLCLIVLIYFLI